MLSPGRHLCWVNRGTLLVVRPALVNSDSGKRPSVSKLAINQTALSVLARDNPQTIIHIADQGVKLWAG